MARGNRPLGRSDDAGEIPGAELLEDRVQQALVLLAEVRALWSYWLEHLDEVQPDSGRSLVALLQDHTMRASWKTQILQTLQPLVSGRAFTTITDQYSALHHNVPRGRRRAAPHTLAHARNRPH